MKTDEKTLYGHNPAFDVQDDPFLPEFDLHQVVMIVRRNALLLIGVVVAVVLAGLIYTLLQVPRYRAESKVLVEQSSDRIIEGSDLNAEASNLDADRFLLTQLDIISSRSLAQRVVSEEGLGADSKFFEAMGADNPLQADLPATAKGPNALQRYRDKVAADLLQASVTTELPPDSRVLAIRVETISPVYSAKLANAYAENYIAANLSRKFASSEYARSFLTKQLDEARRKVETSERDLNHYSRAAGLIRVTGKNEGGDTALSVTNDTLVQANTAASSATSERVDAQDKWRTIENEPVLSIPQVLQSAAVQQMIQKRGELTVQLAEERSRHLDDYPTVVALRAQISALNERINAVGGNIKRSVHLEFVAAQEKERTLLERVNNLRDSALDEQDRGVQYSVLKRVADTNRALYDSLLERYNQLSASAGAASNNISLVDAAEVPVKAASPNYFLSILLALILGIVIAVAVVLLREYFDDVLRSPNDVEAKLGVPLLGLIPKVSDSDVNEILADPRSGVSEAYHSLVTNLMHATSHGLPSVLLVTSASEGQGKTTTSHAIAVDLARLGRRVLLMDGDLRRPTLHSRMPNRSQVGLSSLIAGGVSLDEALVPAPVEGLTYMSALPIPPNPTVLLASSRFEQILKSVREQFDIVVIDSAPLLGLSDAALLSTHAEGTIMMADASRFNRGSIKSSLRRLKMVNANLLGVVLTKFDPKGAQGDYNYYGYNYYTYESKTIEGA